MNDTQHADPYAGNPGSRTLDAQGKVIAEEPPTQPHPIAAAPQAEAAAPAESAAASPGEPEAPPATERSFAGQSTRNPRKGGTAP